MIPDFSLQAGDIDQTAILTKRLLSLTLTQTTGKEADELELEFDDAGNVIALPAHGAKLTLAIGWRGQTLEKAGVFTVDETSIKGSPDRVCVKAKSADMRQKLKAHKNRAWHATTTGEIIRRIASDQALEAQVHPDLDGITVDHRDQTNESDLHFATRLGRDHDAVASVKGGKLILAPKGAAVSASGKSLAPLQLTRADMTTWSMINSDRDKQGSVRAAHRDMTAAAIKYVTAGAGDPVKTLRHIHPSEAAATNAAHAHHRKGKRMSHGVTLNFDLGRPDAFAGRPIVISGVRDGIDGKWIIAKVTQSLDWESDGFKTELEATVDGLTEDSGDATPGYAGDDADPDGTPESGE